MHFEIIEKFVKCFESGVNGNSCLCDGKYMKAKNVEFVCLVASSLIDWMAILLV
jgi:hypothetical protein